MFIVKSFHLPNCHALVRKWARFFIKDCISYCGYVLFFWEDFDNWSIWIPSSFLDLIWSARPFLHQIGFSFWFKVTQFWTWIYRPTQVFFTNTLIFWLPSSLVLSSSSRNNTRSSISISSVNFILVYMHACFNVPVGMPAKIGLNGNSMVRHQFSCINGYQPWTEYSTHTVLIAFEIVQ